MKTMRFSSITSDIERKIRWGVFGEKMPATPELTAMYKCSKSTVTNALHPLVRSGLLQMHSRRGGLCIDRSRLRSGAIGIVGRWPTGAEFSPESNISSLLEQIRKDGFEPVILNHSSEQDSIGSVQHFHDGFEGLIFAGSSINEEIALALERKHIPFISCNRLPLNRRLNFVGFDIFDPIAKLLDILVERGYKNIAFIIPGRVEGFNTMVRKNWLKLKRVRNLPILPCDRVLLNWRDSQSDQIKQFIAVCRKRKIVLDAFIVWNSLTDEELQQITEAFSIPQETLLITKKTSREMPSVECVKLDIVSSHVLIANAYEALRELIYAPSGKIIKRFVSLKDDWIQGEIPFRY